MRGVPTTWQAREVALVLPRPAPPAELAPAPGTRLARAVWDRARRFDLEAGGRADPVGAFHVRWRDPAEDQATIWRLEWDPARGGSEDEVRRAIAVLGGSNT